MLHLRFSLATSMAIALSACVYDFDAYSVDAGSGGSGAAGTSSSTSSAGGGSTTSTTGNGGGSTTGTGGGGAGQGGAGGTGAGGGCVDTGSAECEPWWDDKWANRRLIQIDNTTLTEPLTDFPWPVRLQQATFDHASVAEADGGDVRFRSFDGGTELAHDIEQWNVGGETVLWVRLEELPPAGDGKLQIWMYYDRAGQNAPNPNGAWDAGFESVHHLAGDFLDATSGNHDGTSPSAAATPTATELGRVGGCYTFDGVDDYIRLPSENDFDFTTALTVSAWIDPDPWTKNRQVVVGKGGNAWNFVRNDSSSQLSFQTTTGTNSDDFLAGVSDPTSGGWHHVAAVYDGTKKYLYVDGVLENQKDYTATLSTSNIAVALGESLSSTGRQFDGKMDEVRISGVGRSASWVRFEHRSLAQPALTIVSAEQTVPATP